MKREYLEIFLPVDSYLAFLAEFEVEGGEAFVFVFLGHGS
jgi:hypothetical protein